MLSLEPFNSVLMEAKVKRMTCNTSEWSLFQLALLLSWLWSHGEFLSFTCSRRDPSLRDTRSTTRAFTWERWIQTSWWQLWSVCLMPSMSKRIVQAPCMRTCLSLRTRWFQESAHVRPFTWHASWSPQRSTLHCGLLASISFQYHVS